MLAQVHIAPVQSQIISLPESLQAQPRGDITQVGNLEVGKIRLDGKVLFQVTAPTSAASGSSTSISLIELRVKEIQFQLSNIIRDGFDPDTLQITPSDLNKQTVIVASNKDWGPRQILTVTRLDAQLKGPGTIDEVAQIWSKRIEQALLQAWEQRQPTYQKQQIPVVLVTLTAMIVGSFGIRMLQKLRGYIRQILAQQQRKLEGTESNPSEPIPFTTSGDETSSQPATKQPRSGIGRYLPQLTLDQQIGINLIVRQVLLATQVVIWFGGLAIILHRFPQTRALGNWLLRVPLAYLAIPLGMMVLKSVIDASLRSYVKAIGDRMKEKGGGDVRLRPRTRSILSVLQELTGYLAVVVGFLLFFYVIEQLQIALIALAAIAILSQSILQDVASTYFILIEDQYALGDWIEIGKVHGKVEKISLRNTQVRAGCGDLFTISNGSFTEVHNFTHRYSGINLFIDVAYSTDLDQAMDVMEQVAKKMQQDSVWGQKITTSQMMGVQTFGDNSITIYFRLMTEAGEQWAVGREYRRRLKPAFDQAGITIPFPQRSIWFENALAFTEIKSSQLPHNSTS